MPLIMDRATTSQVKPQKHSSFHCTHRCSTSPLVLDCWELTHMIFLVLSKKVLLAKLSKFIKSQLFTQLICTHYSNLSGRPNISLGYGMFKNQVQNMDPEKQGAKNRVIIIEKEKRLPGLFSF